jgi:hypothetical protein
MFDDTDKLPLPDVCTAVTPEDKLRAFDNWVTWIMSRNQNTWTDKEKNAVRVAAHRALRTL